ncbi:hypothetical protein Tco_1508287, partial [Tanacetum coccineum]
MCYGQGRPGPALRDKQDKAYLILLGKQGEMRSVHGQGTSGVAVFGLLGAVRAQEKDDDRLSKAKYQRLRGSRNFVPSLLANEEGHELTEITDTKDSKEEKDNTDDLEHKEEIKENKITPTEITM